MPDRFTGTMLTKINTQGGLPEDPAKAFGRMSEETDKALLDILKKVNELAGTSADASATGSTLSGLGGALSSAIKGMKYGLDVIYVSSDTLSILPGAVEVNGELVVCPNALSITSSMANFPAAGAWAYVTMEKGGKHRLFQATGTAAQRPTDNCFQWTGGGVGFLDLGKQGYYYDPARRIIGAVHKVNATTWYIISQGAGIIESGSDANGYYRKFSDGTLEQWGSINTFYIGSTANFFGSTSGTSNITGATITFPLSSTNGGYISVPKVIPVDNLYGTVHIYSPSVNSINVQVISTAGSVSQVDWVAKGFWK